MRPGADEFAEAGLLEGLTGAEREGRLELLGWLAERGVTAAEMQKAAAEDRLVLLGVERVLGGSPEYSGTEIAELSGVDIDTLEALWGALGLAIHDRDERSFTAEDLEQARRVATFVGFGIDGAQIVETARVLGHVMSRYAETIRQLFAETFIESGDSESDVALRFATMAELLLPLSDPTLAHSFRIQLREQMRSDVITAVERLQGSVVGTTERAIGFADLVGFTALGEEVPSEDLGQIAAHLATLVREHVHSPVRVVKEIGDAVMLDCQDPLQLVEALLALVDAAEAEPDLPSLKAGVSSGPVVARFGDLFGAPVNRASRITSRARPASVLCDEAVFEALEEAAGIRFSYAGEHHLRGVARPVVLYRAREDAEVS